MTGAVHAKPHLFAVGGLREVLTVVRGGRAYPEPWFWV